MAASTSTIAPVWRDQGRVRGWFHTKAGAKFLNLQTAWFRLAAPKGYAVLTTIGRKTGRPRRVNIRAIIQDERVFVVAITGRDHGFTDAWVHNLEAKPDVRLRIGRRNRTGSTRLPKEDDERLEARALYAGTINWFDFVSSVVNQRGIPWPRRIRELHCRWADEGELFVIELNS